MPPWGAQGLLRVRKGQWRASRSSMHFKPTWSSQEPTFMRVFGFPVLNQNVLYCCLHLALILETYCECMELLPSYPLLVVWSLLLLDWDLAFQSPFSACAKDNVFAGYHTFSKDSCPYNTSPYSLFLPAPTPVL